MSPELLPVLSDSLELWIRQWEREVASRREVVAEKDQGVQVYTLEVLGPICQRLGY